MDNVGRLKLKQVGFERADLAALLHHDVEEFLPILGKLLDDPIARRLVDPKLDHLPLKRLDFFLLFGCFTLRFLLAGRVLPWLVVSGNLLGHGRLRPDIAGLRPPGGFQNLLNFPDLSIDGHAVNQILLAVLGLNRDASEFALVAEAAQRAKRAWHAGTCEKPGCFVDSQRILRLVNRWLALAGCIRLRLVVAGHV